MPKLTRHIDMSGEHQEYMLDGKFVAMVNHDQHGWSGMEAVDDALCTIADIMGWEVVTEEFDADVEPETDYETDDH